MQLFDDRLCIKSPGLPLPPLTLEKIRSFKVEPFSRNPRIATTLSEMKLMEERGWGLKKMHDLLIDHGLGAPEFEYSEGYFVVTFFSRDREIGEIQIAPEFKARLDTRQIGYLDFIVKQSRFTSSDFAKHFNIDVSNARRQIKRLIKVGLLERLGRGTGTYYVIAGF